MTKPIKLTISTIIFVSFIGLIEYYIGWSVLLAPWQTISNRALVLATLGMIISYLIRTIRLYDYFLPQMTNQFFIALKLTLQHNCLLHLLPFRSGEISYPMLMKRYFAIAYHQSIPSLLWFRFLDLHTLGIFALIYLIFADQIPIYYLWIASCIWCTIPWIAFKYSKTLITLITRWSPPALQVHLVNFNQGLPQSTPAFLRAWFWTLLNWAVKLQVFAWILVLFISVPFIAALLGAVTGDLSSMLPIHGLAGMGTFEMGVVVGLLPFNVDWKDAIQGGFNLHLFILSTALISGLLSLLISSKTNTIVTSHGSKSTHLD